MGLDIRVAATPQQVIDKLKGEMAYAKGIDENRIEMDIAHLERMINNGLIFEHDTINVRPGFYSGLHVLRCEYARIKEWDVTGDDVVYGGPALDSHLINHSDCDGYYLPSSFPKPICNNDLSVGSSTVLLMELRDIERDWSSKGSPLCEDKNLQYAWDCLYLAAIASVFCKRTIYFE